MASQGSNSPVRGVSSSEGAPRRFTVRTAGRLAGVLLGALGGILFWRFLTINEDVKPPKPGTEAMVVDNLRSLIVRKDGLPVWEISADRIHVLADTSKTEVENMRRGVLYRQGKPFLTISAPKVLLKNGSNDLKATGGLTATGTDGLQLKTASADWKHDSGELTCGQTVQASLRGLRMSLPRVKYEWNRNTLTAPGPVDVRGDGLWLRGAKLRVQTDTRVVQLDGGAVLTFEPRLLEQRPTPGQSSPSD